MLTNTCFNHVAAITQRRYSWAFCYNVGVCMFSIMMVSRSMRMGIFLSLLSALFVAAYVPPMSANMVGPWHFSMHFVAFAVLGGLTGWALSCLAGFWQTLLLVVIPCVHEICEITGHHHRLEYNDIMVDIVGGIIGLMLIKLVKKLIVSLRH